ncbi:MAG: hypothetical protein J0H07_04075 [Sphingobacteriales bacterium]|nr:hypothetical protein [Sphingobacteriales bacterium]
MSEADQSKKEEHLIAYFEKAKKIVTRLLERLKEDIDHHFSVTPGKEFTRAGITAINFDGCYHVLCIAPDGKLIDFYKRIK